MPFINVKTNASVTKEKAESIKSALGTAITAIPGKSEGWLMVGIEDGYKLWFKGTDEPAAMVEVQLYCLIISEYLRTGYMSAICVPKTGAGTGLISKQFGRRFKRRRSY